MARKQQRSGLLFALILAACTRSDAGNPPDNTAALTAAEAQVGERLAAMGTATQAGDINGLLGVWAPDVRIIETQVMMDGEPQAKQMMEGFFGGFTVADLKLTALETVAHDSGTVVYQFGYLTQTLNSRELGQSLPVRNNFALRWVKDASGSWQMHRFIATAAPKDAPADAQVSALRVSGDSIDSALVESQIAQRLQLYQTERAGGDAARISAFWADDAQFYAPEVQHMNKAALATYTSEVLNAYRIEGVALQPTETFVHDNGNVVYQFGTHTERLIEKTGQQAPTETRNNFMARWKRDASGAWVMDRFLATPQPPPG